MPTQELSFRELLEIFPEGQEIILENARLFCEEVDRENQLWEDQQIEREQEKKISYVRAKLKNTKETKVKFEEFFAGIMRTGIQAELKRDIDPIIRDIFIRANQNKINHDWIEPLEKEIKRLERIIRKYEWTKNPPSEGTITDLDIAHAKEYPIKQLVPVNQAGFILCPFHREKSGSCKIHKDNRFHCYGCGADGDVIDLVMKMFDLDFINAVKKILNK